MDFTGKSDDFLHGYHSAMQEVAETALKRTRELEAQHAKMKPGFFGSAKPGHYLALGGGRVSKEFSEFAYQSGTAAYDEMVRRRNTRGVRT